MIQTLCLAVTLAAAAPPAPLPEPLQKLALPQAHVPLENLLSSGQISKEQMLALRDLGYTAFISLRPATEEGTGWEEALAGQEGLRFIRIPIAGADDLTRENAERLGQGIAAAGTGKTAVFCASGNRVGALLALKAHTLDGLDAEASLDLGLKAGLTRLEPSVRSLLGLPGKKP